MKILFKTFLVAGLSVAMVSCSTVPEPYGNTYPNQYPQKGVYRAGDGAVYGQGEVYRDINGNVYKNGRIIRTGDVYGRPGIISREGKSTSYGKNRPPGQSKKKYSGKTTDYAKGKQKKRDRIYRNGQWEEKRRSDDEGRWGDGKEWKKENRKYKGKKNKE